MATTGSVVAGSGVDVDPEVVVSVVMVSVVMVTVVVVGDLVVSGVQIVLASDKKH